MTSPCPDCQSGTLYERKEGTFTTRVCYVCGHYEDDSEAFAKYPRLMQTLFKEGFPKRIINQSPKMGHQFESPEDGTVPSHAQFTIHPQRS